jgi:tetratricopeptide (TPR) repeat protein
MESIPLSTSSSEFERGAPATNLLSGADRQAVAEIVVTLRASQRGCIYFGVSSNRQKISAVEAELGQALSSHGMDTERVVLAERDASAEPPTFRALIPNLFDYFERATPRMSCLYLIHGLPELIRAQTGGDSSKVAPISQLLNYRREYFRDKRLCALFWLDPESVAYVMQKAPDFWSFRSGVAQLADTSEAAAIQARGSTGRQHSEPSGQWPGDLAEKLQQLAAYRKKIPPDENAVGNLLLDIGRLYVHRHEFQDAFDALHEAEEIFERLKLPRQITSVKTLLARAFRQTGQFDKAEGFIRRAIEIDQELQSEANLAADYGDLSQIYKVRGKLEEAEKWLRKAIEIAERLGDEPKLAIYYNNLSQIYDARGHLEEAEKWLRQAIEIDERLGDEPKLAIRYSNLSQIYQDRGQLEEAEKWLRKALALMEPKGQSATLETLRSNLDRLEKLKKQQHPLP